MAKRRLAAIGSDSEEDDYESSGAGHDFDESDSKHSPRSKGSPQELGGSSDNETESYPVTLRLRNGRKRLRNTAAEGSDSETPNKGKTPPAKAAPAADDDEEDQDPEFNVSDDDDDSSESPDSDFDSEAEHERVKSEDDGFVVDSDDNPVRRSRNRPKRKKVSRNDRHALRVKRRHAYRATVQSDSSDGDGAMDMADELAELREDQTPSPRVRSLRHRDPVDYGVVPLAMRVNQAAAADAQAQAAFAAASKKKEVRRLFNVKGPFGGADVVSIFNPQRADLEALIASGGPVGSGPVGGGTGNSLVADVDPVGAGDVDFSQVGGLDDYIDKLKEMVSLPLMYPEVYEKFGITPPRGVLFHGPPGTGKTLMARALAASHKEKKVTFFMRKGADLLSKWVGEAERQLKALFDEAKTQQPSIIFFDEIDGLAPVRSSKQEQIHSSIVSTLLALMDGMDNRGQVVVIGATNRPDSVDPALRRPGRFDREFYFPLPNLAARRKILEIHTRKWNPRPEAKFLDEIASLSKGYGGADLRALCTEAALAAIQRQYPQIYSSSQRLIVDPDSIIVKPEDFALSLEHIQPSTQRAGANSGASLPSRIAPLLEPAFKLIEERLEVLAPMTKSPAQKPHGQLSYEHYRRVNSFKSARVHRPRLLIIGDRGHGHEYVVNAIINKLEGVFTQVIDLLSLYGDASSTPQAVLVQLVAEARKRAPACFVIPQLEAWDDTPLAGTLWGLLHGLLPSEPLMVIGVADVENVGELSPATNDFFVGGGEPEKLTTHTTPEILKNHFFASLLDFCRRTPFECRDITEVPPQHVKRLPVAPENETSSAGGAESEAKGVSAEEQRLKDIRTRSQLKVKLGPLMDAFKTRYRRFRKPIVEDIVLLHLFEPLPIGAPPPEYVRSPDDMILEVSTGRKFHNMDLDIVEDRLWNGYYCEPRQLLDDIEMIHADSVASGDRDRMHKASEMLANAQVAIDDITDQAFLQACRDLRLREAKRFLHELDTTETAQAEAAILDDAAALDAPGDDNNDQPGTPTPAEGSINGSATIVEKSEAVSEPIQPHQSVGTPAPSPKVESTEIHTEQATATHPGPTVLDQQVPKIVEESGDGRAEKLNGEASHSEQTNGPEPTDEVPMPDASEAEENEEEVEEEHPPFELDSTNLDQFADNLVEAAMGKSLEDLELLNAGLTAIAWEHRGDWNRNEMIRDLNNYIK